MKQFFKLLMVSSLVLAGTAQSATANQSSRVYDVVNVSANDMLNLRQGAGVSSSVLAQIPANGKGVVATGEQKTVGGSVWSRVVWAGVDGWVNRRYIQEDQILAQARQQVVNRPAVSGKPVQAPKQKQTVIACHGVQPNWRLDITPRMMNIAFNGKLRYQATVNFRKQSANNKSIAVVAAKRNQVGTTVLLQKTNACKVNAGKRNYPYQVTAVLQDHQVVSGCCQVLSQ